MTDRRPHDPSTEILLRCTVPVEDVASENASAPRQLPLRASLIDSARRLLAATGAGVSVEQAAELAGVSLRAARSQFDNPDQLLGAVLIDEIENLARELAHRELTEALVQAATRISEHPLLEIFTGPGQGVLAQLARVDVRCAGWQRAALVVEVALSQAGRRGSPMVLRWLSSYLCAPGAPADIQADAEILVAGLPAALTQSGWSGRRTG